MHDTFTDEFGMVDFQRSQHGSGMSQRSQVCVCVCVCACVRGVCVCVREWCELLKPNILYFIQARRLVCALTRAANQTSNSVFTVQQIKDVARVNSHQ